MTVHEDWRDAAIMPDASNISYGQASFFLPKFDRFILGTNGASPLMGKYLSTVHYMSAQAFERIGGSLKDRREPYWE